MKTFSYQALTKDGRVVDGQLAAPDIQEVYKRLEFLGLLPIAVRDSNTRSPSVATRVSGLSIRDLLQERPTDEDVTNFIRDLSILLRSEIRINQALGLLADKQLGGRLQSQISALMAAVTSGDSFAAALARTPELFPRNIVAMAEIGEASGTLGPTLAAIAEQRIRIAVLKRKMRDAITYPAFLLTGSFALLVFFLLYVIPQFSAMYSELGSKADTLLRVLLALSSFTNQNPRVLLVLILAIGVAVLLLLRNAEARSAMSARMARLPVIRELASDYRTAVFCRTMATLLSGGAHLPNALQLTSQAMETAGNQQTWREAQSRIRQGMRLSQALEPVSDLAPIALKMIKIGEEAGKVPNLLFNAADIVEVRLERRIQSVTSVIGPAAILLTATLIGGLVVTLITSVISLGQLAN